MFRNESFPNLKKFKLDLGGDYLGGFGKNEQIYLEKFIKMIPQFEGIDFKNSPIELSRIELLKTLILRARKLKKIDICKNVFNCGEYFNVQAVELLSIYKNLPKLTVLNLNFHEKLPESKIPYVNLKEKCLFQMKDELLIELLNGKLHLEKLFISSSLVSSNMFLTCKNELENLLVLDISYCSNLDPKDLRIIFEICKCLERLYLKGIFFDLTTLRTMAALRNTLIFLDISKNEFFDELYMQEFLQIDLKLKTLVMVDMEISFECLKQLVFSPLLHKHLITLELHVEKGEKYDFILKNFDKFHDLEKLTLSKETTFTPNFIESLTLNQILQKEIDLNPKFKKILMNAINEVNSKKIFIKLKEFNQYPKLLDFMLLRIHKTNEKFEKIIFDFSDQKLDEKQKMN